MRSSALPKSQRGRHGRLMTASPEPTVVKVGELNALVDSVPYLLGFTPTESIVVVSLRGPRERMEFSVRLDLVPEAYDQQVAEMFAARMLHAKADSVMVFVYTEEERTERGLPRRALVDALVAAMPLDVREAFLVTDERIWSYLCDETCCPSEGKLRAQTPASLALAAAHALHGDVVLPDRDAVVATVQPVTGDRAEVMGRAIDEAAEAWAAVDEQRARTKARRLANKLRARYEVPPATISDAEAAALIVAMHDLRIRDMLIGWASRASSDAMRTLLLDVARLAVPPLDAPACTTFAMASYLHGNGLVATSAMERALGSDPHYSLALILQEALDRQVPPSLLREASIW